LLPFVPNSGRTFRVLAWIDATHVSIARHVGRRLDSDSAIFEVDVRTGAAREQVPVPGQAWGANLQMAPDLLTAPTFEAPEPQRPLDPRVVACWGGGALLLALSRASSLYAVSDPDARGRFDEFVAARMPALLRTAYLLTGSQPDAEDLVQTALVRAVPRWSRIVGDPEPYVRKILVNENISRWRRRRGREVPVQPPETGVADRATDDRLVLAQALAALAPRQRAVIVLRYYEDLTEKETATLLGSRSAPRVAGPRRPGPAADGAARPDRRAGAARAPGGTPVRPTCP
jgi:RNA polymerase sigma-70 factor (sigma-E family)